MVEKVEKVQCPVCEDWFYLCGIAAHVRGHEKDTDCPQCGKPVKRENKFCNSACSAVYNKNRKGTGFRGTDICVNCGTELHRKDSHKRKYCNSECMKEYRYKQYIERWLEGKESGNYAGDCEAISNYVRRWLFERADSKCEKCGWAEVHPDTGRIPLTANHINGKWDDTRPDNLELICPNCHSLTSTYGNLNAGNGRGKRLAKVMAKKKGLINANA